MANTRNYYDLLGVPQNASQDDIKRAYRKIVKDYHPDTNSDPNATEQFKVLTIARETLVDPLRRRAYDISLRQNEISHMNETQKSSTIKPYKLNTTDSFFVPREYKFPKEGVRFSLRTMQLIGAYTLVRRVPVDRVIRIPILDTNGNPTSRDWARVYRWGNDIFTQIAVDNFFHTKPGEEIALRGTQIQYMGAKREKTRIVSRESFLNTALFPGCAGQSGWLSTPQRVQPTLEDADGYQWQAISAGYVDKKLHTVVPLPEHAIQELGVYLWAQERIAEMLTNKKGEAHAPTDPWKIIDTFTWQHLAKGQHPDKALYRNDWDLPQKDSREYLHTEPSWKIDSLKTLNDSLCLFNEYVHTHRLVKPTSFEGILAFDPKYPGQMEHGSSHGMRK